MEAIEIRDTLLNEHSEALARRRKLVALSVAGLADFNAIALLQSGIVNRLPDIPYPIFDTNGINKSKTSFAMGVPDSIISSVMFAMKMALATAGGGEKASRKPIFDVLLGVVSLGHALGAVKLTYKMFFKQKKICIYCLTGAALILSSLAVITPTAIEAGKRLFKS